MLTSQNISNPRIAEFYEGKEIFITGGSGYIGKALIEKLLRSCPKIKVIYVLLRHKKNKSIEERLNDILNSSLYDLLREKYPENFQKIIPICGDLLEPNLGISKKDLECISNVSLIFHAAATVRFDEPLQDAIIKNIRGTRDLLNVVKNFKNLLVFAHVSTGYCNFDKYVIEEKVYQPYANYDDAIDVAENFDKNLLQTFIVKYSSYLPNTYVFSKNLGESLVNDFKNEMPIIIFRPAIVLPALSEPQSGWCDNFNGPIGYLIAGGFGLIKTMYMDDTVISDLVPVDINVKALIVSVYKKGISNDDKNSLQVYNCSMQNFNKLSMRKIVEVGEKILHENPFEKTPFPPGGKATLCPVMYFIRLYFLQLLLSVIGDIILKVTTKTKPRFIKLQRKIFAGLGVAKSFGATYWDFKNDKYLELENCIMKEDYEEFSFLRNRQYEMYEYSENFIKWIKRHNFNESTIATRATKIRYMILKTISWTCHVLQIVIPLMLLYPYFLSKFDRIFPNQSYGYLKS